MAQDVVNVAAPPAPTRTPISRGNNAIKTSLPQAQSMFQAPWDPGLRPVPVRRSSRRNTRSVRPSSRSPITPSVPARQCRSKARTRSKRATPGLRPSAPGTRNTSIRGRPGGKGAGGASSLVATDWERGAGAGVRGPRRRPCKHGGHAELFGEAKDEGPTPGRLGKQAVPNQAPGSTQPPRSSARPLPLPPDHPGRSFRSRRIGPGPQPVHRPLSRESSQQVEASPRTNSEAA